MFAARREHLAALIEPALAAGQWVVSDRFSDATYAYQVVAAGSTRRSSTRSSSGILGCSLTSPSCLTSTLRPPRHGIGRHRQAPDRFEREQRSFFERVRNAISSGCGGRRHASWSSMRAAPGGDREQVLAALQRLPA